jgi:glycerophosphoryl diester phosphodiesterase
MKKLTLILTLLIMVMPSTLEARRKENMKTDIVAHRGFWNCEEAGYAKNSIAALRCAQEAGFWGSEFDVNITADSVLIVYHDGEINGKKIEEHPYSEFKDFKIANGETIPTIDEFLAQGKKYPATKLVYELKPQSNPRTEDTFVNLAIANLAENGLLDPDRVMFISFSRNICERLARMLPGYTVQYLNSDMDPDQLDALNINGVDYNHEVFVKNPKWYRMARKNGMSVNAWTVNKEEDMARMIKLGVDQITTDYPLELRALLK